MGVLPSSILSCWEGFRESVLCRAFSLTWDDVQPALVALPEVLPACVHRETQLHKVQLAVARSSWKEARGARHIAGMKDALAREERRRAQKIAALTADKRFREAASEQQTLEARSKELLGDITVEQVPNRFPLYPPSGYHEPVSADIAILSCEQTSE